MKSVAIFNNKGGVGKTTLLCNLAAFLAIESKRKILVVDADPQCNATQLTFVKAHGSIDDPHSMIFTRNQYATARTTHASFYRLLDALIMTSTILMVGVGLDDPDFQLLFEDNRARFQNALPHYMTYGGNPNPDLIQTTRDTLGTKLLPYSPKSNHAALVTSLKDLVSKVSDERTVLTRTMDW